MENSRNKHFISFKLCRILRNVMKSHAVQLCPAWEMNHPSVQLILPVSHLVAFSFIRLTVQVGITVLVFKSAVPKHFGTREQFRGGQFFYGPGWGDGGLAIKNNIYFNSFFSCSLLGYKNKILYINLVSCNHSKFNYQLLQFFDRFLRILYSYIS